MQVKSGAWASRTGYLPRLRHTDDRRWLHLENPLLQSFPMPPWMARKEHQKCLNRSFKGSARPPAPFFRQLPKTPPNTFENPLFSPKMILTLTRTKALYPLLQKRSKITANFNAKLQPNPCLFIGDFQSFCIQSEAKVWPLSILTPYTTSPEPSSTVPSSETVATCGGRQWPFWVPMHSHYKFCLLHLVPLILQMPFWPFPKYPWSIQLYH